MNTIVILRKLHCLICNKTVAVTAGDFVNIFQSSDLASRLEALLSVKIDSNCHELSRICLGCERNVAILEAYLRKLETFKGYFARTCGLNGIILADYHGADSNPDVEEQPDGLSENIQGSISDGMGGLLEEQLSSNVTNVAVESSQQENVTSDVQKQSYAPAQLSAPGPHEIESVEDIMASISDVIPSPIKIAPVLNSQEDISPAQQSGQHTVPSQGANEGPMSEVNRTNTHYKRPYKAISSDSRAFSCSLCSKKFMSKNHLTQHVRTHTGEKPYECEICQSSFSISSNLNRHMRVHTGARPYACKLCTTTYVQSSHLKRHMQVHQRSVPIKCIFCCQTFATDSIYTEHMKAEHSGERPFKCPVCSESFSSRFDFADHRQLHPSCKRILKCPFCSKRFMKKVALDVHVRTHTGEKPFQCQNCGSHFASRHSLVQHRRKQVCECKSIAETFKCGLCPASYVLERNLRIHARLHKENRGLHHCPCCDALFIKKVGLEKHMKTHRNEERILDMCKTSLKGDIKIKMPYILVHPDKSKKVDASPKKPPLSTIKLNGKGKKTCAKSSAKRCQKSSSQIPAGTLTQNQEPIQSINTEDRTVSVDLQKDLKTQRNLEEAVAGDKSPKKHPFPPGKPKVDKPYILVHPGNSNKDESSPQKSPLPVSKVGEKEKGTSEELSNIASLSSTVTLSPCKMTQQGKNSQDGSSPAIEKVINVELFQHSYAKKLDDQITKSRGKKRSMPPSLSSCFPSAVPEKSPAPVGPIMIKMGDNPTLPGTDPPVTKPASSLLPTSPIIQSSPRETLRDLLCPSKANSKPSPSPEKKYLVIKFIPKKDNPPQSGNFSNLT